MAELGIDMAIADRATRDRAAAWLGRAGVELPAFATLANPWRLARSRVSGAPSVDPDHADPANLFRIHWHNDRTRRVTVQLPVHLIFPAELTGVRAPIAMALGCFFPMIGAHKVLAAYGCLIPRLVTGRFDPAHHRAVWRSRASSAAEASRYCPKG